LQYGYQKPQNLMLISIEKVSKRLMRNKVISEKVTKKFSFLFLLPGIVSKSFRPITFFG